MQKVYESEMLTTEIPHTGNHPGDTISQSALPYTFTPQHRMVGIIAAWAIAVLGVAYAVVTTLGFRSLQSPEDPIGDPYVSLMELLIVVMVPLYVLMMITIHAYTPSARKVYSQAALIFMILLAGLTSAVHFTVLTVGPTMTAAGMPSLFLEWKWPSIAYALDILAWDWFFALALLCVAPVFDHGALEKAARALLVVSGLLSLAGLLGVLLADMQVRNIGIIGYAVVAPVAFLLIGVRFARMQLFAPLTGR